MRIKRLELKNFRGFEELTINFPEDSNVAVFVGVNGAGKTSVLEAIEKLLSGFIYMELYADIFLYKKRNDDEAYEVIDSRKDIKINNSFYEIKLFINLLTDFEVSANVNKSKSKFDLTVIPPVNSYFSFDDENLVELDRKVNDSIFKVDEIKTLRENVREENFFIVSYPTDRSVYRNPSLEAKDINVPIYNIFEKAFMQFTNFNFFFEWFRSLEDVENEQIRFKEDAKFRSKELEAVRKAISTFLPNFNNPRVQRQPQEELIVEKNGEKLSISNLSHGERLMFAMVGDIARRLSIANPGLDDPLQGEGVVLIDEIELHLHPGWQRKIVPLLTETFPNIQFILTTHSPQVISSVERESVFILEDFKLVEKTPHTFGRDSNSILQDLFNVTERPDEVKKEFRKLYRLMDKPEETETTKHLLKEMEEKYGADDPEIMRAKMHLEFLNEE